MEPIGSISNQLVTQSNLLDLWSKFLEVSTQNQIRRRQLRRPSQSSRRAFEISSRLKEMLRKEALRREVTHPKPHKIRKEDSKLDITIQLSHSV